MTVSFFPAPLYLDLSLGRILTKRPEDGANLGTGAASLSIAELTEGILVHPCRVLSEVIISCVVTFLSVL